MRRFATLVLLSAAALLLAGCIAGTPEADATIQAGALSGMFLGFWHGLIAPATFIAQMIAQYHPGWFSSGVRAYQGVGAGFSYNIGFSFGLFFWPFFLFWRPRF